ncbi:MAG: pyridoxal phosphate-dependent aminotransferase [Treponema sp.]|jgi:aminotransferase/cystathionine beta-lyase|nr:pyridoxal phosphate-dependent aminotransferase [Treponema sp.]
MKYDFTKRVDRQGLGSAKWEDMYKKKPNVSPGVVPLSVADMELPNPPEIVAGLKGFLDHAVLGYTTATPEYKKSVVGWMKKRHNWDIQEDWIIQSPGVVPAFFIAVKAFSQPGDGVIIMPPVYYPFSMAVSINGRTLVNNPLVLKDGTYHIDYDDLEAKAKDPKNKLLIFCSPHNPVGRVWTKEELQRVADICNRNKVLMISDEIHFDLLLPGVNHTVYATLSEEAAQNCVICTAPSKTFNLAGMQTSNIIIPNKELREKLSAEFMTNATFMVGILGLKACEIAYTQCDQWLDELCELLAANHKLIKDFMAANLPKITVFPLEGTYLQWLDFRALGLDFKALEELMINDAEWFLDEGAMFGTEGQGFERVNIACPTSVLQEALDRLLKALKARKLA